MNEAGASFGRCLGWAIVFAVGVHAARADGPSLAGPATDAEMAQLIRQLGDASFAARTHATRRLCAIGVPAAERLREAAEGTDAEAAIRANRILAVIDRVMFAGVEVQLSLSRPAVAWDDAVDLIVTLTNRSAHPAQVPFLLDPSRRAELDEDARQVGDMLDLADLIEVRDPAGRAVDVHVDDFSAEPTVSEAVHGRLDGGPISELAPSQRMSLTAHAVNRGFARYRLLDRGRYTIVLDYVPSWQDEALAAQRVGRVISNEATLEVNVAAPETVSRAGAEPSVEVRREGSALVAALVNRSDQAVVVNLNFGGPPPFAEGRWVWETDASRHEAPAGPLGGVVWTDFKADRLREIPPGDFVEMARIDIGELKRILAAAGAPPGADGQVHFAYLNLCDRAWQSRQKRSLVGNEDVPAVLQNPLPRRLLSARQTSRPVAFTSAD